MIDLKSMTLEEITDTLRDMGEPAFRGKQVLFYQLFRQERMYSAARLAPPASRKLRAMWAVCSL